jgi:hypothetical protein
MSPVSGAAVRSFAGTIPLLDLKTTQQAYITFP